MVRAIFYEFDIILDGLRVGGLAQVASGLPNLCRNNDSCKAMKETIDIQPFLKPMKTRQDKEFGTLTTNSEPGLLAKNPGRLLAFGLPWSNLTCCLASELVGCLIPRPPGGSKK